MGYHPALDTQSVYMPQALVWHLLCQQTLQCSGDFTELVRELEASAFHDH